MQPRTKNVIITLLILILIALVVWFALCALIFHSAFCAFIKVSPLGWFMSNEQIIASVNKGFWQALHDWWYGK